MDIVIIADFCGILNINNNNRFSYLANKLKENNNVELITSNFNHSNKKHYEKISKKYPYKVTMLNEPFYPTNICLRRFYAHYNWGKNVGKYLRKREKPDVIYCAVPTLKASFEAANYCKMNGIRFIVDVQDLWPEAFQMVFHVPIVSNIIFAPFRWMADYIYKSADEVIAVSQTYVDRVMCVNRKCKEGHSVFLGTELETFDRNARKETVLQKKSNEIWLAYCGTLGSSYDLTNAIKAVAKVKSPNLKFIIMGDGPLKDKFVKLATEEEINAIFTGRLAYDEMCSVLSACDIAINPIMQGAAQSIINKHADYAMAGLPVINTQENEEYRDLLQIYKCGISCDPGSVNDIAKALDMLVVSSEERKNMGTGSRRMAVEIFDRNQTYQIIDTVIKGVIK